MFNLFSNLTYLWQPNLNSFQASKIKYGNLFPSLTNLNGFFGIPDILSLTQMPGLKNFHVGTMTGSHHLFSYLNALNQKAEKIELRFRMQTDDENDDFVDNEESSDSESSSDESSDFESFSSVSSDSTSSDSESFNHESGAKEPGAEGPGAEHSDPEESSSDESSDDESGAEESGAQDPGAEDPGADDTDSEESSDDEMNQPLIVQPPLPMAPFQPLMVQPHLTVLKINTFQCVEPIPFEQYKQLFSSFPNIVELDLKFQKVTDFREPVRSLSWPDPTRDPTWPEPNRPDLTWSGLARPDLNLT